MSSLCRTSLLRPFLPLLTILVAACALGPRTAPSPFDAQDLAHVAIVIDNKGYDELTVWVDSPAGRFRLGKVGGCAAVRFVPPPEVLGAAGPYHLVGTYSGRRDSVTSPPISAVQGATAVWTIEQSEWLSTVVIR